MREEAHTKPGLRSASRGIPGRLGGGGGWNTFVIAGASSLFCLALWLFIELADDAPEGDYLAFENRILLAFRDPDDPARGIGPPWLPVVARDITALGDVFVLMLVTFTVAGLALLRRSFRTAALVVVATGGAYAINGGLKGLFERARPTVVPHLVEQTSLSFPSGHSMVGAATYLTLGAIVAQVFARRREKVYVLACAALLSFLIGTSRVYLGVHYPSDVLAGWSAGTAWALLCWAAALWLQRRGAIETPADGASKL
jgi:undecaprenyl-diphosphatase